MLIILISMAIFIYIVGIIFYIYNETAENIEFHEGGLLGIGYNTCSNRKITFKDIKMSLLWPTMGVTWFIKTTVWMTLDSLDFIFLFFCYKKYKKSKFYKFMNRIFG